MLKEYSLLMKFFFKRMGLLDIEATKLLYLPELEQCLSSAMALNITGNISTSSIFIHVPNETELSKFLNNVKANYISVLGSFVNMLKSFIKHANLLTTNPVYMKLPQMIDYFIKSFSAFLAITPYYNLPMQSGLFESIDSLFAFLIICLRINDYYPVFNENKNLLIDKVILPCLALTPREATSFYEDPSEFILFSLQVV